MEALVRKWQRKGPKTAAGGTPYTLLLEATSYGRVVVNRLTILCQGTAHTLSVMQVLKHVKVGADAAAAQTDFKVTDAYHALLGAVTGDWVAIEAFDGTLQVGTITVGASAGGFRTYTLSANLAKAVSAGAKLYWFDVPATHEQVPVPAGATTTWESDYGYWGADERSFPILLHVDNAVAASTIQACVCPVIDA